MADVFISYARTDEAFVRQLFIALDKEGRDTWIDWRSIGMTAEWWREIQAGIEAANTFLFIITPNSLASPYCHLELAHARAHNKRIVVLVHLDAKADEALGKIAAIRPDNVMQGVIGQRDLLFIARDNWDLLGHINWIFFRADVEFETAFEQLIMAVETDLRHVQTHTRLMVHAREWATLGKSSDLLLVGDEIFTAEAWLI